MKHRTFHAFPAAALLVFLSSAAAAQSGSITGRVASAETGAAVSSAAIEVSSAGRNVAQAISREDGSYSVTGLAAGRYDVVARRIGFKAQRRSGVTVSTGAPASADFTLTPAVTQMNEVVVTATGVTAAQKAIDAPGAMGVVPQGQIVERATLGIADHLKALPGVDVSTGGLVQANIVTRGFNNAFSGAMLILQDNRFAAVPSLRVNVPLLFPSVNEDIERVEVLLGPAAALYGPNSANGVLHIITKSPFTSQGGTATIGGGERGVLRGSARYAGLLGSKVGYKISGEFLRGEDWEYDDPAEPDSILRPTGAISGTTAVRQKVANVRDYVIEKTSGEARIDFRPKDNIEWINTFGLTQAGNYIEITGANGAAQARNWGYQSAQSRFRWNRTFAQVFYNTSNAGNADSLDASGTFLLRTGTPIVDNSRVLSAQLQQSFDLGAKQTFIAGGDYIFTNPRTGGTINGRNEDIDDVTEVGGYLHSVTRIDPRLDLVAALRVDKHSELDENFLSPRAALVFKPTPTQNLRLTYNRAFSTPANFTYFLDLPQGRIPLTSTIGYGIRALGVGANGYQYTTGSASGVGGLYMRSPFPVLGANPAGAPAFGPDARIDAHAGLLYRTLVAGNQATIVTALMNAGVTAGNVGTVFQNLLGTTAPTSAQVGTVLRLFDPSGVGTPAGPFARVMTPGELQAVDPIKPTFDNTWEAGYKGILGRWRMSVNGWYQQKENFTTPAVNIAPNAFMNPTQLGAYIAGILTAEAAAGRVPAAAVGPLTTAFTGQFAAVPVGTVVPDQPGVAPDAGLTNRSDIVFTYRTVNETIELWGSDMALDFDLTDRVTLMSTYSWVSRTKFPNIPAGVDTLRLNAPQHKGSLTARYSDDVSGWTTEVRGRYTDAFRVNSGVYVGRVPVNALLDLNVSYKLQTIGRGMTLSLAASNLLDERVPTFVGVPAIGRLIMTKVQYDF